MYFVKTALCGIAYIWKKNNRVQKMVHRFRGDFLIHASKTVDIEACIYYKMNINLVAKGAIIGKALIYDIKKYTTNEEFVLDKTNIYL